jgi:hypothetical protein
LVLAGLGPQVDPTSSVPTPPSFVGSKDLPSIGGSRELRLHAVVRLVSDDAGQLPPDDADSEHDAATPNG